MSTSPGDGEHALRSATARLRAGRVSLRLVAFVATLVAIYYVGASAFRSPLEVPGGDAKRLDAAPLVDRRLTLARTEADQALERQVDELQEFFRERRLRTREFAASVLSLSSKLSLVNGHMPWGDADAHSRWVREEFARIVFSDQELAAAVRRAGEAYERSLRDVESEMLVELRADVEQAAPGLDVSSLTSAALDEWIATLRRQSDQVVGDAVRREVAAEIAVSVAGDLAALAATEALVSAGILGVGGASAAETLGIGLVAAIAVDFAWTSFTDPIGRLTIQIDEAIATLTKRVLDGDDRQAGVRAALSEFARSREQERRAALLRALDECQRPASRERS